MKKPKISIIIPVYNAEKYLGACLDSILNQTFDDFEIVCVNDGSNDESVNILEEYNTKSSKVKLINKENGGVISARIAGFKEACGEYIGWVDADDFIENNMLEVMYISALNNDADVVYCNYNFFPNEVVNKTKWYNPYRGVVDWKFIMNNTIQWNKLVKKELLDEMNITSLFENMGEGCYGLVFINSNTIISIDEPLYNYRVGHSSISGSFNNLKWYKIVVKRALNMAEYVKENNYDKEWVKYYTYRYLYYNLILMIVSVYQNNKKEY